MAGFGVAQLIFSQIPNFSKVWWLSVVATIMSFFYSSVAFGLGISKAIGELLSLLRSASEKGFL
jgi:hypothetical protein